MSTILYFFDPTSREFIGSRVAQIIPGIGIEAPSNAVLVVPPAHDEHQAAVLQQDGQWQLVADHRGPAWEKATGRAVTITELGDVPTELTLVAPGPADRWDEGAGGWHADLSVLRALRLQQLQVEMQSRLQDGFSFSGAKFPATPSAVSGYATAAMQATVNKQSTPPVDIAFRNFGPEMDNDQVIALSQACQAFVAGMTQQLEAAAAALQAAATADAITAVDLPAPVA